MAAHHLAFCVSDTNVIDNTVLIVRLFGVSPVSGDSTGLTAATMAEALKLQKMRLMMGFHGNSTHQRQHSGERTMSPSENDDTGMS